MKKIISNIIILFVVLISVNEVKADRIKDMASVAGVRSNQLV